MDHMVDKAWNGETEAIDPTLSPMLLRSFEAHTHTHTHTHTRWFLWFTGTFHRRNGFYTVQSVCAIDLHLPYT